eukprot:1147486-Pelagomonas_calceolata.AAC.7
MGHLCPHALNHKCISPWPPSSELEHLTPSKNINCIGGDNSLLQQRKRRHTGSKEPSTSCSIHAPQELTSAGETRMRTGWHTSPGWGVR